MLLQPKEEDQSVYKRSKLLILLIFYVYSVDNLFFIYCTVTFICVQNRLHFNRKDLKYVSVESLTDVNTFSMINELNKAFQIDGVCLLMFVYDTVILEREKSLGRRH